jgi:hypothetical protein
MSTIKVDNIRIASESVSRPVTGVAAAYAWVDMMTNPNDKPPEGQSLNTSSVTYKGVGSYNVAITSGMSSQLSVSALNSLRSSFGIISGNSGQSMVTVNDVLVVSKNNTSGNSTDTEFTMLLHGDLA